MRASRRKARAEGGARRFRSRGAEVARSCPDVSRSCCIICASVFLLGRARTANLVGGIVISNPLLRFRTLEATT